MRHITITREHDVRTVWPLVAGGIDAIMERAPDYLEWSHHNVLGELMHNSAGCKLYLVESDDHYAGFVVLRLLRDEFTKAPVCHVWLCYLQQDGLLDEVIRFAIEEGRRHKCKFVRLESNRSGWGRVLKKYGGEPRYTVYQKEL